MKNIKYLTASCIGEGWRDEYRRKIVSAEEAVRVVKSGDRVVFPIASQPRLLGPALAARKNELHNVTIHTIAPQADLGGFFEEDQNDDIFYPTCWYIHDFVRKAPAGTDSKHTVYYPGMWSIEFKPFDERPEECSCRVDVAMVTVSPPDKDGFCSFGANLWHTRSYCQRAKTVVAQVDETQIRTGGTNFIHVSEIDYFVELATPPPLTDELKEELLSRTEPAVRRLVEPIIPRIAKSRRLSIVSMLPTMKLEEAKVMLTNLGMAGPPPEASAMAQYIAQLIKDGDTFNIGAGSRVASWIPQLGAFDDKHDLGLYSESVWAGFTRLVEKGIITGKYKTFNPGMVTVSSFSQANQEDLDFIDGNPIFECYDAEYLIDIRNVSRNDNFVAINQAVSVDLTGQINSESGLAGRMISGPGGQPELHIGAVLSKGGRAITLLPSTALNGAISRIVPQFESGTVITIPRYFTDYIVTEYGIASLMGKDCRQRANELIAVAHPDFRVELKQAAKELFYP